MKLRNKFMLGWTVVLIYTSRLVPKSFWEIWCFTAMILTALVAGVVLILEVTRITERNDVPVDLTEAVGFAAQAAMDVLNRVTLRAFLSVYLAVLACTCGSLVWTSLNDRNRLITVIEVLHKHHLCAGLALYCICSCLPSRN